MDSSAREIFKSSLIKGLINKYSAKKETLLAQITLLLESDAVGPEEVASLFEKKINRLSEVETNLVQLEMMFMGQKEKNDPPGQENHDE